ncbi:MAG TPA: AtpZ/AtpI family protein, partial [Candidatus Xenobia bacterium]
QEVPPPSSGGLQAVGLVFSLGATIAGCIVGGYWLGHLVDQHLGTTAGALIGLMLGLIAALVGAIRLLKPFMKG